MRITRTEIIVLGDPPKENPPDGSQIDGLAFLRIHTDEGLTGLSEIFAVPPAVAQAVLDGPDSLFGHLLEGQDPIHPERLWTRLYNSMLHGNRRGWVIICLGAVDVALWDIYGKAVGRPVWQLLGGVERSNHQITGEEQRREAVPYCTIISDAWDRDTVLRQQVERVAQLRELGYRAFKVEPMRQSREVIVELARLTREAIGPEALLAIDVGYLWNDVGEALRTIEAAARYDLLFFETPFPVDAVEAYARLTERTSVPIAVGEQTITRIKFRQHMDKGGVSVAQPYMTTCGGLTEAKRIVTMAQQRGALVCPGNWSTGVLGAATLHLAAYSPVTPVYESAPAEIYTSPLRRALQELAPPVVDGAVAWPEAPGIGIELPKELVTHFARDVRAWRYHEPQE